MTPQDTRATCGEPTMAAAAGHGTTEEMAAAYNVWLALYRKGDRVASALAYAAFEEARTEALDRNLGR